jgi:hypothetical protein
LPPSKLLTGPALGLRAGKIADAIIEQTTIAKETSMWFRSLFDALIFPRRTLTQPRREGSRVRQRPRSFRPLLEVLEDRALLASYTVNSLTDTGAGSGLTGDLRYCIANAISGQDAIGFAAGLTGAIQLGSALPPLNASVAIQGPGADRLTVERAQSNFTSFGIFAVGSAANVQISGLTIANANVGAIYNAGTLTINASTLSGNSAVAASRGGAISNTGTLTVSNSTLSGNSAIDEGGAIYDAGGTLTLDHCTLSGNEAHGSNGYVFFVQGFPGGSGAGGGLYVAGGMVNVNQSTFSSNQAVGGTGNPADACSGVSAGDGSPGEGGGLYVAGGTVSIVNSTFSANEARGGDGGAGGYCPDAPDPINSHVPGGNGGPSAGGGIRVAAGTVQVHHSTFSGNRATGGLGGYDDNYGFGSPGVGVGDGISNAGGLQMYDTVLTSNINNSSAAAGLLVSGTNKVVGNIDGSGTTQVNAGSDLTANHIIQNSLLIGGVAGSPALVTIAASDASGNPLTLTTASTAMDATTGSSQLAAPSATGTLAIAAPASTTTAWSVSPSSFAVAPSTHGSSGSALVVKSKTSDSAGLIALKSSSESVSVVSDLAKSLSKESELSVLLTSAGVSSISDAAAQRKRQDIVVTIRTGDLVHRDPVAAAFADADVLEWAASNPASGPSSADADLSLLADELLEAMGQHWLL